MSLYTNRTMLSLLNMTREMYRKNIEISRISKTCAILLMSGLSKHDIHSGILERCLRSQREDGGFIANTDTIWNIKLLEFFPEFCDRRISAIEWLVTGNGLEKGFGRSKRDMHRIPVTGLALYLLPEIANDKELEWLERAWLSEQNSLTYKAAYTLLAFQECSYCSSRTHLMQDTVDWLLSQQQPSGGFAPWRDHPVGENVYCTAVAMLALLRVGSNSCQEAVKRARDYLHKTQLESGIWPYHEIEDGASWGLLALSQYELCIGE